MTITRRKFLAFALISVLAVVIVMLAGALAADLYMHHRAERSAGLNRWGYRGPVVGRKQAGEVRFAMLGGSTAFGYGVRWDEAIPSLLEAELRARYPETRWTGLNLGYNTEGAWAFLPNLEDFSNLDYDIVVLYEGYNDLLGDKAPNHVVVRRQSPVFRATGYFPILPLAFREKALALRAGGDVAAGYATLQEGAPQTVFRPGIATRTSATALDAAAAIAESLGRQFDGVGANDPAPSSRPGDLGCASPWVTYCESVSRAIRFALAHGRRVVVATQPTAVDPRMRPLHQSQQHALAEMLARDFANEPRVAYVDLSGAVDLSDSDLAFDRMHLGTDGNRVIAKALTETVARLAPPP